MMRHHGRTSSTPAGNGGSKLGGEYPSAVMAGKSGCLHALSLYVFGDLWLSVWRFLVPFPRKSLDDLSNLLCQNDMAPSPWKTGLVRMLFSPCQQWQVGDCFEQ